MPLLLAVCKVIAGTPWNDRVSFNQGWLFKLQTIADTTNLSAPHMDDTTWRPLNLPHDWAIEGEFSQNNPSGTGGGALPGGVGWYRKHFETPANLKPGDRVYIDFDGAYMNASVFVNGVFMGRRPYGYAPFSYDVTPQLKAHGTNVIAVKVDNAEQPNSRWYSGCGIYRNTWLRRTHGVSVPQWGVHIVPSDITDQNARLNITTDVVNSTPKTQKVTMTQCLLDANGVEVARQSVALTLAPQSTEHYNHALSISNPKRWSPQTPYLYSLVTELNVDNRMVARYRERTGFRTITFDANRGFFLNERQTKLKGVCLHHDAGALGAVVNRRAIERQLQIMKEMGVNAIRVSHNPPAPELLTLCDSMGLMVMDEAFDMWHKKKTQHDYARYFDEWHEKDLSDLLRRDRNHPSVIMWSIGNEVLEQWTDARADTLSLEQANLILNFGHDIDTIANDMKELSVNAMLTRKLADVVRNLDRTRPITAGCNEPDPSNHLFRSKALDVIGYNYHDEWYAKVPRLFPGKPFVITESVSALMTRGYYRMPSDSVYIWPERWDKPFYDKSFSCSSYDNCHVPWGATHEKMMAAVANNDFVMGQFVWTGFDYLGEPTPFGWPARSSYFGIVDLAGFPKDVYYMYQSQWRPDKTVLHLFPHWNWTPGQTIDLWAYYNNADEVELFVNGCSQGVRRPQSGIYHAAWRVTFEPGEVVAVSRKNGREVARRVISTAGKPYVVRLLPDRRVITADGSDLCYVSVEVVDKDGHLCPWAQNDIVFNVDGPAFVAGVDNGSPISMEPFKANRRKTFYGKAMLILQSTGRRGAIRVRATSEDLVSATATVIAK